MAGAVVGAVGDYFTFSAKTEAVRRAAEEDDKTSGTLAQALSDHFRIDQLEAKGRSADKLTREERDELRVLRDRAANQSIRIAPTRRPRPPAPPSTAPAQPGFPPTTRPVHD